MSSTVTLKTSGLTTEPNQLTAPEGSLTAASNVVIQRDNVIEPRRGFGLFGTAFGTITDTLKQIMQYKSRLLRQWGSTLEYDTGTVDNAGDELFLPFDASVLEPQPGLRIKSVEMNGNFYFTSSQGIRKISAATTSQFTTDAGFLTLSGGVKALDFTATPTSEQGELTGFLGQDGTVEYRIVWGTIDNNNNLILGVPSNAVDVTLSLGSLLVLDFDTVLQEIQNIANAGGANASLINEEDYIASLLLNSNASPQQVQAALVALALKLDENIVVAENPTTAGVPLTISAINIVNNPTLTSNNTATITFSAGNPEDYWSTGSNINLNNFPNGENGPNQPTDVPGIVGAPGNVNGPQVITAVTPTTISFITAATGNVQTFSSADVIIDTATPPPAINSIVLANNGFKNFDPVTFANSGGALPTALTAGTVYYLGNVTATGFQVFADSSLTTQIIFTDQGSGTDTVTYFMPVTGTSINSYEFEAITPVPGIPDSPATDAELVALQAYLQAIVTQLQTFPTTGTPPIISAFSQTTFADVINLTTSSNVKLVITIPEAITSNYFLQIYRSPVTQATGTTSISLLSPSDELQQVYEAYPTAAELAAGIMTVVDDVPDSFLGADLYTNEASGVGIANANEDPPFALDINKFMNTIFLANTRTKYRMSLNLLGVAKMITDYLAGDTPQLVIADGITTNIYSFVLGVNQITEIMTVADVGGSLAGTYFLIWSATNATEYYVWYNVNGVGTDPMIPGATGIEVFLNTGDSAAAVATKTAEALSAAGVNDFTTTSSTTFTSANVDLTNDTITTQAPQVFSNEPVQFTTTGTLPAPLVTGTTYYVGTVTPNSFQLFTAPGPTGLVTLTSVGTGTFTMTAFPPAGTILIFNNAQGFTNNAEPGTSGFTITTPVEGVGQETTSTAATYTTRADVAGNLAGTYFTINSAFDNTKYYIWYSVSGVGVDPEVPGATGVEINIATNDSANTVAAKTTAQLNVLSTEFTASNPSPPSDTLIVATQSFGPSDTPPTAGTTGFGLTFTYGVLQVLLSNNPDPAEAVNETAISLVQVINRNYGEILYAFYLSNSSTVPGQMNLESRTLTTPEYYLLANNVDTGASFSPNLSPTIVISSISAGGPNSNVVTTTTPHGMETGDKVMISNTNSSPTADGLWTITNLSPTTFRINTTITAPATQGALTPAVNANGGNNDSLPNRIYFSTLQEPESFPLPNTIDVGDVDKAILRIFPLRDSLFVFKEDGLFRISGTAAPFTLQLFDSSCIAIAPDSVNVAKNVIYAWTTQGILNVTESGVSNPPISRRIDVNILPITNQTYPNFSTATWGVGYESDNSYLVFTVSDPTDTVATIAYRYSVLTSSWTTWDKSDICGIVNLADDKLYLGPGDINSMEQERKNFNRYDYADRAFTTQLNDANYFQSTLNLPAIGLSNVSDYAVGDVLVQNQNVTVYEFNTLLQKLNLDNGLLFNQISSITTGSAPIVTTIGDHYLTTGNYVNITGTQTTPIINGLYQVIVLSPDSFQITVPSPVLTAGTVGIVKYSYYDTLEIGAGANLETALNSLVTRLNTEPNLFFKQDTVAIVSNSIANPTILTTATNTLGPVGTIRTVSVTGNTGSVPSINGNWQATVIDSTHVSLPVNVTVAGTGGTLTTLDDYLTGISHLSGTITNISVANPTVVTSPNDGFVSNRYINITGSNSNPVIDGNYNITIVDNNNFTVPVNVLLQGTTGTWSTLDGTFQDLLVNYNYIISLLNADTTDFRNYKPITTVTTQEAIIEEVNLSSNQIVINPNLEYVVGPLLIYQAIKSTFTYSPVTFQDPLSLKQISEATLMFENKAFSNATLSFQSDLYPQFYDIDFVGNGNGSFGLGSGVFGGNFFGGGANAAPFRTYIPRNIQRCRYIIPMFTHSIAFEKYIINGLTLTGTVAQSTRAYR